MSTELLLVEDVAGLGNQGDVVKVADGYARNFLIPKGKAEVMTEASRRRMAKLKAERERRLKEYLDAAKAVAAKLSKVSVTLRMKTVDGEALYGSVSAAMIADEIKAQGVEGIEPAMVSLDGNIKQLGTFDVEIKPHPEVSATIKVWVVAED